MIITAILSACAALAAPQHPVSGPAADDAARIRAVEAVFASTTVEWRAHFATQGRSYSPPRLVFIHVPSGHPARGSGYDPRIGLTIDLGDIRAIDEGFGEDASLMTAILVGHEVGHHIQALLQPVRPRGVALDPTRELQADCFAGWWLASAKARATRERQQNHLGTAGLEQALPRLLKLFSDLSGDKKAFISSPPLTPDARLTAIRNGISGSSLALCGAA
ncbi:hypothetical protein BH11PSE2_BH11PSE2_08710 [soil metagenome]